MQKDNTIKYPKRLIEVDLPIKRISEHASREKSIRHGHISTLHIWWARRPLAACRAVLCASLWPDPADPLCPKEFINTARELMAKWSKEHLKLLGPISQENFIKFSKDNSLLENNFNLRSALLDFIADFANWDNSTNEVFIRTSKYLTKSAHESLGGEAGTMPLVVDPFAGGGSIPLEALRVGADTFASDLNPISILLNKSLLEIIPKYGEDLEKEVEKLGVIIKKEMEQAILKYYSAGHDNSNPDAYLWARTIICEGPSCGARIPLIKSLCIAKRKNGYIGLKFSIHEKNINFNLIHTTKNKEFEKGVIKRGNVYCPVCGYVTPVNSVRKQLKTKNGGANDARLYCVIITEKNSRGKTYRLPDDSDLAIFKTVRDDLNKYKDDSIKGFSLIPDEKLPEPLEGREGTLGFGVQGYGMKRWKDIFTDRQLLILVKILRIFETLKATTPIERAAKTIMSFVFDRLVSQSNSLAKWQSKGEFCVGTFDKQVLQIIWDFCEINPIGDISGNLDGAIDWIIRVIRHERVIERTGLTSPKSISAENSPLSDESADCIFTDPPYYDAVPYSDLSDFFYIWLKRTISDIYPELFNTNLAPKKNECIVDLNKNKDKLYFESTMQKSMGECRRVLRPDGIGAVVFAHKSTEGWEAQLQSMMKAGWIFTASWPIDTERSGRLRAVNSAALNSSVHLICRPRENSDGSLREDAIGEWREVLQELPKRLHEWMPRLAKEGVVGADAIFACLGPALEIFSRYSKVEKTNGEEVTLNEYLEYVWGAVAKEALNTIFQDADTSGLEEDARLTVMWLWTLFAALNQGEETDDTDPLSGSLKAEGFSLDSDTAFKISKGLGIRLEGLKSIVKVEGEETRLLSLSERAIFLFNSQPKEDMDLKTQRNRSTQQTFLNDLEEIQNTSNKYSNNDIIANIESKTLLDKVHIAMLFFGSARNEALKKFIVEEGNGANQQFWKLAQALSALYPSQSDEKRWVDGLLAKKKGFGF